MTKKQTLMIPTLDTLRGAQALAERGGDGDVEAVIYEERVSGRSIREIALMFQRKPDEVEQVIAAMAEASRQRIAAEMSIATIVELDRLDALMATLWVSAKGGDVGCIDRVVNISKERRKLLGLDAGTFNLVPNDVDLSGLSLEEIKALEAIQSKLKAGKAKGAPQDALRRSSGPLKEGVVDVPFTVEPPSPKPKRNRKAVLGEQPGSLPDA